jgi:peptide/nickel transport system permease protein
MMRYIIRRVLFMIPVVLGVIMITFLLFNVVGGSPAAMALGKNASPRALEEFDEQQGMNKPVLWGWWTPTRAFPDAVFPEGLQFAAPALYSPPLVFSLRPDTVYRLRCRISTVSAVMSWRPGEDVTSLTADDSGIRLGGSGAPVSRVVEFVFRTGAHPPAAPVSLSLERGACRIDRVDLRRRMPHWTDSQLACFFGRLAKGDLGTSLATHEKVTAMLRRGVGPSLALTVPIFTGGLVLSVGLALACAYWRNRWVDRVLVLAAVALMSVNYLVWIIFGQFFLAYKLRWFPIWGFESWRYLLLPVLIGITSGLGANLRFYRTVLLDDLYKDYVRTAYAKGLGPVAVLFRHVLPNAMIPIVTNTALVLPFLYTGNLLLESFFGIPGLGGLSVNAVNSSDVDVVRGVVLVGSLLYVVASLVTDLCYALVDPRVKLR